MANKIGKKELSFPRKWRLKRKWKKITLTLARIGVQSCVIIRLYILGAENGESLVHEDWVSVSVRNSVGFDQDTTIKILKLVAE